MASEETDARLLSCLERVSSRLPNAITLTLWRDLLSGTLPFTRVLDSFRRSPGLTYLTIDTSSVCDLTCPGMCYYHPGIDTKQRPALEPALAAAIESAHTSLFLGNLVFAGKEPLLGVDRLVRLVRFAEMLPDRGFSIGVVTNGRNILRNWDKLDPLAHDKLLTFLDISIDSGFPGQHDTLRGRAGTFDLAFAALARCASSWPGVRVGLTSVLRQDNADGILELIRRAAVHTRKFFITPIQPPPFTDTPPLAWGQVRDFLQALRHTLTTEWREAGLEVMVSLLGLYAWDASRDGMLDWGALQEDAQGQVFVEQEVGNNVLALHLQVIPETAYRVARITHTGAYLPNTHFVQTPYPEQFAVGNVTDESLPVLYQRALADDGLLAAMYRSRSNHTCRARPCWSACFGGLAAAEHCIVSSRPLKQQPHLCIKTDYDFTRLGG